MFGSSLVPAIAVSDNHGMPLRSFSSQGALPCSAFPLAASRWLLMEQAARPRLRLALFITVFLVIVLPLGYFFGRVNNRAEANAAQPAADKDAKKGEIRPLLVLGDLRLKHLGSVTSVAFSPDGKRLVSASADQTVKVWDAATGSETLTLKGHTGGVFSVAFSPDGKRLASAARTRQ